MFLYSGWSERPSGRGERLPADWPLRCRIVMERDRRRCQWLRADTGEPCGLPASDVDHIEPGDNHDLSNLQALCRFHHLKKTGGETAGSRPPRARPAPRHPGLLG